ncbi:MAG: N-acetylmuramoyl-L-alanine amidase [Chitinophagaceae bacterium]
MIISLINISLVAQPNVSYAKKIKKIILDPGHGGKDPGCHGVYSKEKDITLAVSRKVKTLLENYFKSGIQVALTRNSDVLAGGDDLSIKQSLIYRTDFANENKGDLFISIHVNSTPKRNSSVKGTLVLVCGQERVSEKANSVNSNSHNFEDEGLLDARDPATSIILAQYTQAFLTRSIVLGSKMNEEFVNQNRVAEGVRQQSLQVLASSAMPGVLVEIGYLNNTEEENYLNSEEGQNEVALAIFNAIKYYKEESEKNSAE